MTTTRISRFLIVDNPPPAFPDVGNLGKSRIGRKLRQKAIDTYCVDLRRYEGRPALSGPPIPNSEKAGHREFYSLAQCRHGGRRSGEARRRKAEKRWRQVMTLQRRGFGIRQIARVVGYSAGWVSKLVKRLCETTAKVFPEHIHHQPPQQSPPPQPQPVKPDTTRALALMLLYSWKLVDLLSHNPTRKARARYEGLLYGFRKGSYKARLERYVAQVHRQSPDAATDALAGAFVCADALSDLPVDEAVRTVNRDFGWGHD